MSAEEKLFQNENLRDYDFINVLHTIIDNKATVVREVSKTGRPASKFVIDLLRDSGLNPTDKTEHGYFLEAVKTFFTPAQATHQQMIEAIPLLATIYRSILYPNPRTMSTRISQLKKVIVKQFSNFPEVLQLAQSSLKAPVEVSKSLKKNYQAKLYDTNKKLRQLDDAEIFSIINKIQFSDDWRDRGILLGLSSGARLIELARLSFFQGYEDDSTYLIQVNVAKKRNGSEEPVIKTEAEYQEMLNMGVEDWAKSKDLQVIKKNLIGIPIDQFTVTLKNFRISIKDLYKVNVGYVQGESPDPPPISNVEVTKRLHRPLSKRVRQLFKDDAMNFHDLRSIYATLSFDLFAPENVSANAWVSDVLGHQKGSLATSISYQKFSIPSSGNLKEIVKELQERISRLEDVVYGRKESKEEAPDAGDQPPPDAGPDEPPPDEGPPPYDGPPDFEPPVQEPLPPPSPPLPPKDTAEEQLFADIGEVITEKKKKRKKKSTKKRKLPENFLENLEKDIKDDGGIIDPTFEVDPYAPDEKKRTFKDLFAELTVPTVPDEFGGVPHKKFIDKKGNEVMVPMPEKHDQETMDEYFELFTDNDIPWTWANVKKLGFTKKAWDLFQRAQKKWIEFINKKKD